MTVRPGDFAKALEHAWREVAYYERQVLRTGAYAWQLKSAQIALEALLLVRQHQMEGVVLGRVKQMRAGAEPH